VLTPYRTMLFFPGGNQAAGASVKVSTDASNVAPLIFTDAAGTTPAANPAIADSQGVVFFYAAPGYYLAELSGTFTRIPVDFTYPTPTWPNLFIHTQAVAATVWTINHFFGIQPMVSVDVGAALVETQVDHPSASQTVITFGVPMTGIAYLRR
jgi:hypothetical protein